MRLARAHAGRSHKIYYVGNSMNYYNEKDPFAAAWLGELIKDGLIPPGHIDTRSITEVIAEDLRGFTQHHFFSGIGGWNLALALAGWPADRPVWTGSCPCQPFSNAGKKKGTDDERHLWPDFFRLIVAYTNLVGPIPTIFGEQVASKDGRVWLSGVQADLESVGYLTGAADLCAAGVAAPHLRQRLYWVAYSNHEGSQGRRQSERKRALERAFGEGGVAEWLAFTNRTGLQQGGEGCPPMGHGEASEPDSGDGWVAHTVSAGRTERGPGAGDGSLAGCSITIRMDDSTSPRHTGPQRDTEGATRDEARMRGLATGREESGLAEPHGGDAGTERQQRGGQHGQQPQDGGDGSLANSESPECESAGGSRERGPRYSDGSPRSSGLADADLEGSGRGRIQRPGEGVSPGAWAPFERLAGFRQDFGPGAIDAFWGVADWVHCRDGKWRRIEPDIFPLVDAGTIRNRVGLLRGSGNAIVPGLAAEFIVAAEEAIQEGEMEVSNQP